MLHQKNTKNCSFWLHEEWLSPQKEHFFCSFVKVIFVEKNVICTFCLAKCIRKGKKKFLLTTWRMALFTKRAFFCSFLNIIFLEKVICTFCLAKCIRKGQKNVPSDYMKNCSLQKKSISFCSFLNVISLEKNVTCTFCLAKCITKGQKNCSFWLHEEWLSPQKEHFLFLSECHLSRKERHLYFLPCQMHLKRTTKLFLLTTWRMALTTKRTFFLFFLKVIFV